MVLVFREKELGEAGAIFLGLGVVEPELIERLRQRRGRPDFHIKPRFAL